MLMGPKPTKKGLATIMELGLGHLESIAVSIIGMTHGKPSLLLFLIQPIHLL